jgi:hypothetical protein
MYSEGHSSIACSEQSEDDAIVAEAIRSLLIVADGEGCSIKSDEFHRARYRLYDLATKEISPSTRHSLFESATVRSLQQRAFERAAQAGEIEEYEIARALLGCPDLSFAMIYERYFGSTYKLFVEDDLAAIQTMSGEFPRRIAYVGGGALPLPAMILAQNYGVEVTCIERTKSNAQCASELARRVGLSAQVTILNQAGDLADYSGYDTVISANWISNRRELVRTVSRFKNVRNLLLRSARADTISPLINDLVQPAAIHSDRFVHWGATTPRPSTSLHTQIFHAM